MGIDSDLKKSLIELVRSRQVAFQYCDELVDFTLDGHDSKAMKLLQKIENANVCLIKDKEQKYPGFQDILDWSIQSDLLFNINNEIVICVSNNYTKELN